MKILKNKLLWLSLLFVLVAGFIVLAIFKPQLPFPVDPKDIILGEWTTDQPANYSPLVTIVFSDSKIGVEYILTPKGYMAEPFTYTIKGNVIELNNKDTGTLTNVVFKMPDSNSLILNLNGQPITFIRDKEDKAYLQNKY